jgi:hypothetical protein
MTQNAAARRFRRKVSCEMQVTLTMERQSALQRVLVDTACEMEMLRCQCTCVYRGAVSSPSDNEYCHVC